MRLITALFLQAVTTVALANEPPTMAGLHVELRFDEAIGLIEAAGGRCETKDSSGAIYYLTANCSLPACPADTGDSDCPQWRRMIAHAADNDERLIYLKMRAGSADATLMRIAFFYTGDHQALAREMVRRLGLPDHDGWNDVPTSWSNSLRMGWVIPPYQVSLVYQPNIILLTRELGDDNR